jgi:hypothetical protein
VVTQVSVTQQMTGDYNTFDTTQYSEVVAKSLDTDPENVNSKKYLNQRRSDGMFFIYFYI